MSSAESFPSRRQKRIRTVSRFLRILSLVGMAYQCSWTLATLVLPVVAKRPSYGQTGEAAESSARSAPQRFSSARVVLELQGVVPAYRNFDGDVSRDGTGIIPGRTGLARFTAGLYMAYSTLGAWLFYCLFKSYQRGDVFRLGSVRCLRSIGIWMMGNWAMALAFNLSKGWWQVNPSVHLVGATGNGLFAGIFICLVAWIMEEAHLLEEEQALTV